METAIRVKNLVKDYENFTLSNINLEIPKGCIMGLVGENGAGKTTLIKCILELVKRNTGEIYINGSKLEHANPDWKNSIGVVMAECFFSETLTALQIDKIMCCIYRNWNTKQFMEYLKVLQLRENKPIKDYSRGMKMKLQIAAALSHDAKILIFDEATSGLDPVVRDEILDILLEYIQDPQRTVILSSHITSDLEKVADYITFLHKGKLIFTESKDDLIYNYGIVRCSPDDYGKIDKKHIAGVRKNQFEYEVMIDNRMDFIKRNKSLIVDNATIEEIILFQIKGGVS